MSVELESIAFDESSSFRRRMIAAKDLLRLERLKRELEVQSGLMKPQPVPILGAQPHGEIPMSDQKRIRLVINCTNDGGPHWIHRGETRLACNSLEELAESLESLDENDLSEAA